MYRRILVAVENSSADRTILSHVRELATLTGAEIPRTRGRRLAARNFEPVEVAQSEEMKVDRAYSNALAQSSLHRR
jgi:manganese transport protein